MKVLIIGSSGLLGKKLYYYLKKKKIDVHHNGLNKKKFNLNTINNVGKLLKKKPDLIINAAAITNIDQCEKSYIKTKLINTDLIKKLFVLKKKLNLHFKLIFFSTDQLYDSNKLSTENDNIKINNKYSKQKYLAENICSKNNSIVFRTNFFGKSFSKNSFTDWVYNSFTHNEKFFLFDDIIFNPLRINTICRIIHKIIITNKYNYSGLYNLGSKGKISKSEFAILFAKKIKIFNYNFERCNSSIILKTKRSKNMSMNVNKFIKTFKIKLPKVIDEIKSECMYYK